MVRQLEERVAPEAIVGLCGGDYGRAVAAATALGRVLWAMMFQDPEAADGPMLGERHVHWTFAKDRVVACLRSGGWEAPVVEALLGRLAQTDLVMKGRPDEARWRTHLDIVHPVMLARRLLGGVRPDHDLRYFTMRSIRRAYDCALSDRIVHTFRLLSDALGGLKPRLAHLPGRAAPSAPRGRRVKDQPRTGTKHFHFHREVLPGLEAALRGMAEEERWAAVDLFLECCRAVGYVRASHHEQCLFRRTEAIDAEYLVTTLFALTTGIRGFDQLFGGSGLLLGEPPRHGPDELPGRTILVSGPFGAGKSMLALQLAVEVARKGGLAVFLLLEQEIEEASFMLESIGAWRDDGAMRIARDNDAAAELLVEPVEGQGALFLLRLSTVKNNFRRFLAELRLAARRMGGERARAYPLRLLVVDPINSVYLGRSRSEPLRARMLRVFQDIQSPGTNILLVAEELSDPARRQRFEQNIADTVIHLSVHREHGYSQRYFSIQKSRLQREQRGEHPFSIEAGRGLCIFPTSAAVATRIRNRTASPPETPVAWGWPSLDAILGDRAIASGDVIVIRGPGGTFKTELGLGFLLSRDRQHADGPGGQHRPKKSLYLAVHDQAPAVEGLLARARRLLIAEARRTGLALPIKATGDVVICPLPRGHVQPGFILDAIEERFQQADIDGYGFDRVLVDDVEHWEISCPFVRQDVTFGDTLLTYLRHRHVTSMLICSDLDMQGRSVVQQSVINGADCLLLTERFTYRGQSRAMIRVAKTRSHGHRRDPFEMTLDERGLVIKPQASLLRVEPSGGVRQVTARLFLHAESSMQDQYNRAQAAALQSVLLPKVVLDHTDWISLGRVQDLGSSSVVDELQVLQLDEFQLSHPHPAAAAPHRGARPGPDGSEAPSGPLFLFPKDAQWSAGDWDSCFPRLVARMQAAHELFCAVPYYTNIGLLAYREDCPAAADGVAGSWEELAEQCRAWESKHGTGDAADPLFFDFPRDSVENINCLFFEILFSLDRGLYQGSEPPDLAAWMGGEAAVRAAGILRQLCHAAYMLRRAGPSPTGPGGPSTVHPNACVWRHWYTTLNQMFSELSPAERGRIRVRMLPGEVSVAGEWYLALPAHTAAPDVGLALIRHLTRRDAELYRLWAGVGMPTRPSFYGEDASAQRALSPYFTLDGRAVGQVIQGAFMRSRIAHYEHISRSLASHLMEIVLIDARSGVEAEPTIRAILRDTVRDMEYLQRYEAL